MAQCNLCERNSADISGALGVCSVCIRRQPREALEIAVRAHRQSRAEFGLPPVPPDSPEGVSCNICVNRCRMADAETDSGGQKTGLGTLSLGKNIAFLRGVDFIDACYTRPMTIFPVYRIVHVYCLDGPGTRQRTLNALPSTLLIYLTSHTRMTQCSTKRESNNKVLFSLSLGLPSCTYSGSPSFGLDDK